MLSLEFIGIMLSLVGSLMVIISAGMTREAYKPTWNPRKWVPVWKQRDMFAPGGFAMNVGGLALLVAGMFLRWVL